MQSVSGKRLIIQAFEKLTNTFGRALEIERFTCWGVIRARAHARHLDFQTGDDPVCTKRPHGCIQFRSTALRESSKGAETYKGASGTRRLAEHIDRSFMRFHGGLPCDVTRNGRLPLPFSRTSLSSLSLSFSGSATSTYFRIARNWHAATAAAASRPPDKATVADICRRLRRLHHLSPVSPRKY